MADQNPLWNRVAELETQLQRVLNLLGQPPEPLPPALFLQAETLRIRVDALQRAADAMPNAVEARVGSVIDDVNILSDTMDVKLGALQDEVNLLKRVVCKTDDQLGTGETPSAGCQRPAVGYYDR
ncbi:hypothetical protein Salat_0237800 [Sesamum alatum]|uniref:Uncharacterized protein n=1 Tax=Sesamum alatum TaxID=300844 RepID=A0AAE1YZ97_9LAMI|nr:hypothetical protein Salat_0237800 [Sesamum alatum]